MRFSLRLMLPLILVLGGFAYGISPLAERLIAQWFVKDIEIRAQLLVHSFETHVAELADRKDFPGIERLFGKVTLDERLFALGLCDGSDRLLVKTKVYPQGVGCASDRASESIEIPTGPVRVSRLPLGDSSYRAVVIHDLSFAHRRGTSTRKYIFAFFVLLSLVVSAITMWAARSGLNNVIRGLRNILTKYPNDPASAAPPEFKPILKDLRTLVSQVQGDRAREGFPQLLWSPERLREILHRELSGEEIIVVSNREPYIHVKDGDQIKVQVPASGLVTALEPVMRACSGTWVAHGSGSADRETVDRYDRVAVPPGRPMYQIRRLWLTEEEEKGYYYGFANEGLWPLCHIAYTRPSFRLEDWEEYVRVNRKFADAVIREAKSSDPIVLVQDYHLALVPKFIRAELPNATIITFWHIPWPNPEAFGICPWRQEILEGLLGSSIMGFQTQYHCHNFLETIDRFLECRVERETSTVSLNGNLCAVKPYPISIDWPPTAAKGQLPVSTSRKLVRDHFGMPEDHALGIGVDRLDYTKGVIERFRAVEKFLDEFPGYIGRFTFLQIAAPTRSTIREYRAHCDEVEALAAEINRKFQAPGRPPAILLKVEHHEPVEIFQFFRAVEFCFVSSLHDGMNLVAKEFVSARDDLRGVLLLSQFTGAAKELPEALIVNPYDVSQCAKAIRFALTMSGDEQAARMKSMRTIVREFNVYRWAGKMLEDGAKLRRRGRLRERLQSI